MILSWKLLSVSGVVKYFMQWQQLIGISVKYGTMSWPVGSSFVSHTIDI
jgi:hypothetical protein